MPDRHPVREQTPYAAVPRNTGQPRLLRRTHLSLMLLEQAFNDLNAKQHFHFRLSVTIHAWTKSIIQP